MIGWIILAGALVGTSVVIRRFWESIRTWLNTVAADAVERVFGPKARENMFKAIVVVDRVIDKVRSVSTVYTKETPMIVRKTTIKGEAYTNDFEKEVLDQIKEEGKILQEYQYSN